MNEGQINLTFALPSKTGDCSISSRVVGIRTRVIKPD